MFHALVWNYGYYFIAPIIEIQIKTSTDTTDWLNVWEPFWKLQFHHYLLDFSIRAIQIIEL